MIDVKLIRKPKNEGSSSAVNTGSTAYSGMSVKEAAHAAKADLAEQAKEALHAADASHADKADEATHATDADHALEADHAKEADHATEADNADKWDYKEFADYLDQPVRKADNVEFGSVETDVIRSAGTFVDGLLGEGFRLWREVDSGGKALTYLCLDKLTVRQTMTMMELLIQKVRSVGGMIVVSAANGRIKSVVEDGDYFVLTFEEATTYQAHDLLRCQTFTGGTLKSYWVEAAEAGETTVKVLKSEFETSQPEAGDDTVLMGNTENTSRQNMVLISATEDGQPRVDVMDGVKTKSFAGALRARLGTLDGINDDAFPSDKQPQGNGLYSDNAYLKGTFLLSTGEDVKTRFEIMEGKVESELTGIRDDFTGEKGYLSNAAFADGMSKWNTQNEAVFFLVGNKWIWANGNVLTKKGDCASVTKDQGRTVVLIRNKYIQQKRSNLRVVPTFEANADGAKQALPVYLSFFYRCQTAGALKVEFENVDKTGFTDFESMSVEETLEATDGYQQYTCSGLWNGTGDFKLSFTGEIYLYMLILSTDKVESLTYKYRTLLEQSEKIVKIAAQNFDKDGNVLAESGIMVKAAGSGIYAQTSDGKLALIGVGVTETDADGTQKTVIKLTADNIQLEGLVTANGNFKILEDGSIEAVNGKFGGEINATSGYIGGFAISSGRLGVANRVLQDDGTYKIVDDNYGLFLYDSMIGFNAKDRQAILGTWNSLGQPMLVRLVDTATDYSYNGKSWGILPKYGIVFDIENSSSGNFAFAGKGNGALNGFIDGYKFTKVNVVKANTVYDTSMMEANRLLVMCTVDNAGIALPRLSNVRNALGIGEKTSFAVRLSVMADLGSKGFGVYGRNNIKNGDDKKLWADEGYPLLTHWNGGRWDSVAMAEGDALEVMLVYDPSRTAKIDDFTTTYTARVINRQE